MFRSGGLGNGCTLHSEMRSGHVNLFCSVMSPLIHLPLHFGLGYEEYSMHALLHLIRGLCLRVPRQPR